MYIKHCIPLETRWKGNRCRYTKKKRNPTPPNKNKFKCTLLAAVSTQPLALWGDTRVNVVKTHSNYAIRKAIYML